MVCRQLYDLLCYRFGGVFMIALNVAMHIALMMITAREGINDRPWFAIGIMSVLAASVCKLIAVLS